MIALLGYAALVFGSIISGLILSGIVFIVLKVFFPGAKYLRLAVFLISFFVFAGCIYVAPSVYWTLRYREFNEAHWSVCEKETDFIFYSEPPREYVGIGSRDNLWSKGTSSHTNWQHMKEYNINSMVAHVKNSWNSVDGREGWFLITRKPERSPSCKAFYDYVDRKNLKVDFLEGECLAFDPINEDVADTSNFLIFSEDWDLVFNKDPYSMGVRTVRIENETTNEVYAQTSSVVANHKGVANKLLTDHSYVEDKRCQAREKLQKVTASPFYLLRAAYVKTYRDNIERASRVQP